ncbi:CDP-diacylglycerol---serine O-phosphatidyltransferase [Azospirillaceae bacterium]
MKEPGLSYDENPLSPRVGSRLLRVLPNMLTLLALASGLMSIHFSIEGHWEWAFYAIVCAAILDLTDGAAARLLHCESRLGAHLDNVADGINFGLAPSVMLWHWSLYDLGLSGVVIAVLFFGCTVARLVRFTICAQSKDHSSFVGVPSPMGAALALLPMALTFQSSHTNGNPFSVAVWTLVVCVLLLAPMLTPSLKGKRNARRFAIPLAVALAMILAQPWLGLMLLDFGYLTILVVTLRTLPLPSRKTPPP